MSELTGDKNVDRVILNKLNDKDLLKHCYTSTKALNFCNDDQLFWMHRVFIRFADKGRDVLKEEKGDREWSEYYRYLSYDKKPKDSLVK